MAAGDLPDYISHVDSFLELLLILFLTTGGQPPHTYDLAYLLLANTESYARSFFIVSEEYGPRHHGNVVILTRSLDEQYVSRLLPPEVSSLLVLYLVDVLPFLHRSQPAGDAVPEATVRSSHLFSDGRTH